MTDNYVHLTAFIQENINDIFAKQFGITDDLITNNAKQLFVDLNHSVEFYSDIQTNIEYLDEFEYQNKVDQTLWSYYVLKNIVIKYLPIPVSSIENFAEYLQRLVELATLAYYLDGGSQICWIQYFKVNQCHTYELYRFTDDLVEDIYKYTMGHHHKHQTHTESKTLKGYYLTQHPYDRCSQISAYASYNPWYGIECFNYMLSPFVHIPSQYRLPMKKHSQERHKKCHCKSMVSPTDTILNY